MWKFYINGAKVSERKFRIINYLYDPLNHYAVTNDKTTFEWGRIPNIIIKKKDNTI